MGRWIGLFINKALLNELLNTSNVAKKVTKIYHPSNGFNHFHEIAILLRCDSIVLFWISSNVDTLNNTKSSGKITCN